MMSANNESIVAAAPPAATVPGPVSAPSTATTTMTNAGPPQQRQSPLGGAMQAAATMTTSQNGADVPMTTAANKRVKHHHYETTAADNQHFPPLHDGWHERSVPEQVDALLEWTMAQVDSKVSALSELATMAFHELDQCRHELVVAQERLAHQDRDLQRSKAAAEKAQATIANLLHATERGHGATRDMAQYVRAEATVRAELRTTQASLREAQAAAAAHERHGALQADELRLVKIKLHRVVQDKLSLEREQRVLTANLMGGGSGGSSSGSMSRASTASLDYWQRHAHELQLKHQGLLATLAEKNRVIDDLRRQMQRAQSQQRLGQLKKNHHGGGRNDDDNPHQAAARVSM